MYMYICIYVYTGVHDLCSAGSRSLLARSSIQEVGNVIDYTYAEVGSSRCFNAEDVRMKQPGNKIKRRRRRNTNQKNK